jgi:hypothetical protein
LEGEDVRLRFRFCLAGPQPDFPGSFAGFLVAAVSVSVSVSVSGSTVVSATATSSPGEGTGWSFIKVEAQDAIKGSALALSSLSSLLSHTDLRLGLLRLERFDEGRLDFERFGEQPRLDLERFVERPLDLLDVPFPFGF